ncbi:MAG: DUF1365 family protein [Cellvibrionaceae bacterium]|jgi:DUF1365 family protein
MSVAVNSNNLNSAIYSGQVRHRRFSPKQNSFVYQVFMVYLDLQELDDVFVQSRWWSQQQFNIAQFKRSDFFDKQSKGSLYEAIADWLELENGRRPEGPIRMLANLRYFGFIINPITCYYCFDKHGQELETIVLEVTNTPWGERCQYILNVTGSTNVSSAQKSQHAQQAISFSKKMHVSPFQPMDLEYHWVGKAPDKNLLVHIDVHQDKQSVFDVTMTLKRQTLSKKNMNSVLWNYPLMTTKVVVGIYWEAVKLFVKRIPFFSMPKPKA